MDTRGEAADEDGLRGLEPAECEEEELLGSHFTAFVVDCGVDEPAVPRKEDVVRGAREDDGGLENCQFDGMRMQL
jgi:hypothetical protein